MPSQFDEKLVAASKELEDTIQKVQQFESKKEKSNAEEILDALNKQVQIAGKMGSLSYTDPKLQAFFAQDALAKGIHEMDTQLTKAEKEAKLQAEKEMKKKQEEWANNHPWEAWLQNFSDRAGEKWDVLRKGTKWVGDNIPFLKDLSDKALVLEGFIGAEGSAISGIAIGATKLGHLALKIGEWGFNSMRGVEIEQWKLDDINGAGNTLKNLGQAIISWQDYPKYGKALLHSVKGYVEKALTDPYALGGAIFDIGSCFIGVGEVTAAVKGTAAFGKFAEGTKVFQAAAKSGKIGSKLEEITALVNKLPGSMKNGLEKVKNIEIPGLFREPLLAGIGNGGGGGLDALKDAAHQFMKKTGEKVFGTGTGEGSKAIGGARKLELSDFTKEILKTKPMNSPKPDKWYKKGGSISIDNNGTWTYTNKSGVSVNYPNGYPDFTPFMHPNVKPVQIEVHSPKNNPKDFENANKAAKLTKDTDPPLIDNQRPPDGYTWHHHEDGKTMMLVDEEIHREFRHIGGQSKVNGKNKNK